MIIGHFICRVKVVHGIKHRGTFIVHFHTAVHSIHHVGSNRKVEVIFQHLG